MGLGGGTRMQVVGFCTSEVFAGYLANDLGSSSERFGGWCDAFIAQIAFQSLLPPKNFHLTWQDCDWL